MAFNPGFVPGAAQSGANVSSVASLAYREGQIQNAIRFLQNSQVSQLTPQLRIRFLEDKGLTCSEIGEALRRTMPSAPETMLVLAAAAKGKTASSAVAGMPDVPGQLPRAALENIQAAMQPLAQAASFNLDSENSAAIASGVPISTPQNQSMPLPTGAVSAVYSPGMVQLGPSLFAFPQYLSSAAAAAAMLGSAASAGGPFQLSPHSKPRSWLSTISTAAAIGLAVYGGYSLYTKWKEAQILHDLHSTIVFRPTGKSEVDINSMSTSDLDERSASQNMAHSAHTGEGPSSTRSSPEVHRVASPASYNGQRLTPTAPYAPVAPSPATNATTAVLKDLVTETKEDIFIRGFDEIKAKLRDTTKDMQGQSRNIAALERMVESLTTLQSKSQQQYTSLLSALSQIQDHLSKANKINNDEQKENAVDEDFTQTTPENDSETRAIDDRRENDVQQSNFQTNVFQPLDSSKPTVEEEQGEKPVETDENMGLNESVEKEILAYTSSRKEKVDSALQALMDTSAPESLIQMLTSTNMYLTNLKNNPDKSVYRRLSLHNPHLKTLVSQEGIRDLIVASGFTQGTSAYEFTTSFQPSSDLREVLGRCTDQNAQDVLEAANKSFQQACFEVLSVAIDHINSSILNLKELTKN